MYMENKEMDTCKLLYNTERVKLYVPEYGRNVQKMVNYLKTIEDRQKRNEQAKAEAQANWEEAKMSPAARRQMMQEEREAQIAAANERTAAANERIEKAKNR